MIKYSSKSNREQKNKKLRFFYIGIKIVYKLINWRIYNYAKISLLHNSSDRDIKIHTTALINEINQ